MINKLINKWKQEWYLRHSADLAREFEAKLKENETLFLKEIECQKAIHEEKIKILKEEEAHRERLVSDRISELKSVDNDLKNQIKILEAKAHPSEVWAQAFSMGVSKTWDMLLPTMTENIEKLRESLFQRATEEALGRLNGNHKKSN